MTPTYFRSPETAEHVGASPPPQRSEVMWEAPPRRRERFKQHSAGL